MLRLLAPTAALVAGVGLGLAVPSTVPSTGTPEPPSAPTSARTPTPAAASDAAPTPWPAVVRELMRRRAEAYAAGCPAGLAEVHRAGSPALVADRTMLRAWTERGLRVDDAVVRVSGVRPLSQRPGRVVLQVAHRLGSAVAVGSYGRRRALPRDQPQAHRVVLVRTEDGWRIAAVSG